MTLRPTVATPNDRPTRRRVEQGVLFDACARLGHGRQSAIGGSALGDVIVRPGLRADVPALVDIFNVYVADGHVTFDTEPTTVDERLVWFERFGSVRHRLFVADAGGTVLGCAYSSQYRSHPAFDETVETSIYLHPGERGRGVGTLLYSTLLEALAHQPVHLAVAGVALPNDASIALHHKLGFETVGTFHEYATKRGVRISSVWLQRRITHRDPLAPAGT